MLSSKYKIPLLITIVFFCLLFFIMPFIILNDGKSGRHEYLVIIFPILSLFLFYSYSRSSPRIVLDDEFLTAKYLFYSKTYDWSAIKDIYLSKKENYMMQNMEATSILFDNGDKLNIWQDVYGNCEQLRSFISQKASEKIRDPSPNIIANNLRSITRRRYSGNVYTSYNTILIVGMAIFFGISIKFKFDFILLIPICFILIFFFGLGTQMNYFLIDEGCLFIRNHYFPWINKKVRLEDIVEVDIETPNKRSTGLRIITKDFNSKLYGAGSLRSKTWKELLSDLRLIGIPSRDDR
jgi:hypothetical protein